MAILSLVLGILCSFLSKSMKYMMLLFLIFMTACSHTEKQSDRGLANSANYLLFSREVSGFLSSVVFVIENKNSKFGYDFYMNPKPRNKYAKANEPILVSQREVIGIEYRTSSGAPASRLEKDGEMIIWLKGNSAEFPKASFAFNLSGQNSGSGGDDASYGVEGQLGSQSYKHVSAVTADTLKSVSIGSGLGSSRNTLADLVARAR